MEEEEEEEGEEEEGEEENKHMTNKLINRLTPYATHQPRPCFMW